MFERDGWMGGKLKKSGNNERSKVCFQCSGAGETGSKTGRTVLPNIFGPKLTSEGGSKETSKILRISHDTLGG